MRTLEDLRKPASPRALVDLSPEFWPRFEEAVLEFKDLETFTCVLGDGGFMREWRAFLPQAATQPPPHTLQEYDDYVEFLTRALPNLHNSGLLRFEKAEL